MILSKMAIWFGKLLTGMQTLGNKLQGTAAKQNLHRWLISRWHGDRGRGLVGMCCHGDDVEDQRMLI